MIGEAHPHHRHDPQIQISSPISLSPPYNGSPPASPTVGYSAAIASLRRYLLSTAEVELPLPAEFSGNMDVPVIDDDEFFMYEFKVRMCTRARAHDWTECPFAHSGEKARRRDPRKYNYSGSACSDFRKGGCKKGDSCEFAHGVFECWLHPTRFRTQACKDGPGCRRRVCFFAHHPDQLRDGSGLATSPGGSQHSNTDYSDDGMLSVGSGYGSVSVIASLRNLQLCKVKSMPSSWTGSGLHVRSPCTVARPGFFSLPTTPTGSGVGYSDWGNPGKKDFDGIVGDEAPLMERVESGRELRTRMFEKLSKENPLNGPGPTEVTGPGPDLGWVTDLVK